VTQPFRFGPDFRLRRRRRSAKSSGTYVSVIVGERASCSHLMARHAQVAGMRAPYASGVHRAITNRASIKDRAATK